MIKRIRRKVYRSIFWRRIYWRFKFIEFSLNRYLMIYYSLLAKFIKLYSNLSYSLSHFVIYVLKVVFLSTLIIIFISRIIIWVKRYKVLENFFTYLFYVIIGRLIKLIRQIQNNITNLLNWLFHIEGINVLQ